MGVSYNGSIKNFQPDNTPKELWIDTEWANKTLTEIIEAAKEHFGDDVNLDNLLIEAEYVHTECLTFDCYDPSDYTKFIHITLQD